MEVGEEGGMVGNGWVESWLQDCIDCQQGLISRAQAREVLTESALRWRLRRDNWSRVAEGVFRAQPAEDPWLGRIQEAVLRTKGLAAFRCAASLYSLDGLDRFNEIEVVTTHDVRLGKEVHVARQKRLPPEFEILAGGVPATTVRDTLVMLGARATRNQVECAVDCAVRRGMTTWRALEDISKRAGSHGRKGPAVLAEILLLRGPKHVATDSLLETLLLQATRTAGLPTPELQYPIYKDGQVIAWADFAWPLFNVLVETLGHNAHSKRRQLTRDCRRSNAIELLRKYTVLRFTWDDVTRDSLNVCRQIAQAIGMPWRNPALR